MPNINWNYGLRTMPSEFKDLKFQWDTNDKKRNNLRAKLQKMHNKDSDLFDRMAKLRIPPKIYLYIFCWKGRSDFCGVPIFRIREEGKIINKKKEIKSEIEDLEKELVPLKKEIENLHFQILCRIHELKIEPIKNEKFVTYKDYKNTYLIESVNIMQILKNWAYSMTTQVNQTPRSVLEAAQNCANCDEESIKTRFNVRRELCEDQNVTQKFISKTRTETIKVTGKIHECQHFNKVRGRFSVLHKPSDISQSAHSETDELKTQLSDLVIKIGEYENFKMQFLAQLVEEK